MNECEHEKRTSRIEHALYGDNTTMGLIHQNKMFGEALMKHVDECSRKHNEKREEDQWWYRLIMGTLATAAISGAIGLIVIGIKVWATK